MRMKLGVVAFFFVFLGMVMPVAAGGNVDVTNKNFTFNNYKYRRVKADSAELGSIGLRKGGVTPRFDKMFVARAGSVKGKAMTEVSLSSVKKLEGDLGGGYKGVSAKVAASKFASGEYKLIKLELNNEAYVDAMNADKGHLQKLADVDKEGNLRVVTAVWIVVTQEEARAINVSGSASADFKVSGNAASVKASGSSSKETKLSVNSGTIFAYELSKVDWASNKRDRVKFLKPDKVGI
jgi:hypothetical protein